MAFLLTSLSLSTVLAAQEPDQPIGLARAVGIAERQLAGRTIDAELDTHDGRLVYEIELVRSETLIEARVDARSGRVVSVRKPRLLGLYRRYLESGRVRHGRALKPLAALLADIEARPGRTVHEASLKAEGGKPVYEVEVATAAGVAKVRYDALTGRRLSVEIDQD